MIFAANSPNCCSGSFNTPATCPPSGVQFYSFFSESVPAGAGFYHNEVNMLMIFPCWIEDNCPDAYAYAFDESSGTALWTCDSSKNVDYTLTFCP